MTCYAMKIDKNFLKCLLKERALFQYINLSKTTANIVWEDIKQLMNNECTHKAIMQYFISFLAENKITQEEFEHEATKQCGGVNYSDLSDIINQSFCWSNTTRGRSFWFKLHYLWIKNYANIIIKPIYGEEFANIFYDSRTF